MLGRAQLCKACLLGSISVTTATASCSSSDSHDVDRAEAGAAGEASDASAGAGGEATTAGGSTGSGAGADQGGTVGASGDSTGGFGTGGVAGTASSGGAGGETECVPLATAGSDGEGGAAAAGESLVLYTNDFESPNVPLVVDCGNSLDTRSINALYGSEAFVYQQVWTVEGVVIDDPTALYSDPEGVAKNYSLGMLSTLQDDLLALTFDVTGKSFLNVGFDLSSIDVQGCGGPVGVAVPVMQVRLYDTPNGTFSFAAPGSLLAQGDVTGVAAPNQWTFAWSYGVVSLDATAATGSSLTVVFDLLQSGYAAFDNLSIVASNTDGVVDRNNDGIPDDQQCLP